MGDGIARIYNLDRFMTSKLVEFAGSTSGLALEPENSYVVGLVALNIKPIPVGSGYAGQLINALGAPSGGTGQDAMILIARYVLRLEQIICDRDTATQ